MGLLFTMDCREDVHVGEYGILANGKLFLQKPKLGENGNRRSISIHGRTDLNFIISFFVSLWLLLFNSRSIASYCNEVFLFCENYSLHNLLSSRPCLLCSLSLFRSDYSSSQFGA